MLTEALRQNDSHLGPAPLTPKESFWEQEIWNLEVQPNKIL